LNNAWQYFTLMTKLVNQHTYINFGKKFKSQYLHNEYIFCILLHHFFLENFSKYQPIDVGQESTISNSFHLMQWMSTHKSIKHWTFDYACFFGVYNLCKPLFPWGKNLQPHLQSTLYNIYFNFNNSMILYHAILHISISWIVINSCCFMFFIVSNLLGIFRPYAL
jgi:hypothetical protein